MSNIESKFMRLAFQKAYEHLGSTKENPSVGCIVVKDGVVISSGVTSINGRPHAEVNALNGRQNYAGSSMFTTLEPCVHYGKTAPCINTIIRKGIKKVYYPISDPDTRTFKKAKKIFIKKRIKVKIGILKSEALKFYKSYFISKKKAALPFLDAKIAISKDFFSVNNQKKWITNGSSRSKGHLLRSRYDCILSTYKSVNKDNSKLDCRIEGLEQLSPTRVIIDRDLKLKKDLDIYKSSKKIPTYIITNRTDNKKEKFLRSKNIKIIKIKDKKVLFSYREVLMQLKKRGFSRILCESGYNTTRALLCDNLVHNLYVFMSSGKLGKKGKNSFKNLLSKLRLKNKEKINVNLSGDNLYKLRIK